MAINDRRNLNPYIKVGQMVKVRSDIKRGVHDNTAVEMEKYAGKTFKVLSVSGGSAKLDTNDEFDWSWHYHHLDLTNYDDLDNPPPAEEVM